MVAGSLWLSVDQLADNKAVVKRLQNLIFTPKISIIMVLAKARGHRLISVYFFDFMPLRCDVSITGIWIPICLRCTIATGCAVRITHAVLCCHF
jgi:hypothetical protein